MPNDNDKKNKSGLQPDGSWVPSSRYERYTGSNPVMLEARARQERESSKPNTQLGSSSATSAGSSKGKSN
ncbi:MAG: hypothetical protein ACEY3B_03270 [Wolbachia sp.]